MEPTALAPLISVSHTFRLLMNFAQTNHAAATTAAAASVYPQVMSQTRNVTIRSACR